MPLWLNLLFLGSLGSLCTIFGAALFAAINTLCIKCSADDVITDTRQVLNTAAANHNDGVLLQVVAYAGDVSSYFITICQTDTGDFTQS